MGLLVAWSKIEKRREVLSLDKAFARAALYDLAGSCGSLTGAANHSGTPLPAQSLHETNARLLRRALVYLHASLSDSRALQI